MMKLDQWHPQFKGSYNYRHENKIYSQENFQVLSNPDNLDLAYLSQSLTRAPNGEFLIIDVLHVYSKNYALRMVEVEKHLGKSHSKESFVYSQQDYQLTYKFFDGEKEDIEKISISHNFHIQTPDIVTSLLFSIAKNQAPGTILGQLVLYSTNMWKYEHPIERKEIIVERSSKGTREDLVINDNKLQGSRYVVFEDSKHEKSREPGIVIFLSKNMGIPYMVSGLDQMIVEIQGLQNMKKKDDFVD